MKTHGIADILDQAAHGPLDTRQLWATARFAMEIENAKARRHGGRGHQHWHVLQAMLTAFKAALKVGLLYGRGVRNALDVRLREVELRFNRLPGAFDGFRLLHVTDTHIDGLPDLVPAAHRVLQGQSVDLCAFGGDYRMEVHGAHDAAVEGMAALAGGIDSRLGFVAVLGNHDGCHMVDPLEEAGIRVLINESVRVRLGRSAIRLIGTDDVHYYYTDQAVEALNGAGEEFAIALVHSPELYSEAAEAGVDLYLCGHTHGGQVCLPGPLPIVRHLNRGREFWRGRWRHGPMVGWTNEGLGVSGLPVRFGTRGEMLLITLRSGAAR